jgi:hypothetical protein
MQFDKPLTEPQLKERGRRLSLLSPASVENEYRRAYEACRLDGENLPRASSMQELVSAWKLMWTWPDERGQTNADDCTAPKAASCEYGVGKTDETA